MAVFLANDSYDYNDDQYTVSATTLLKPIRQLVLAARVPAEAQAVDLSSMIASRMGTAIHDAIENAWVNKYQTAMQALGYPQRVIEQVRVNPDPKTVEDGQIPIYLEQRSHKKVGKWTVSGKFDFVGDGRVEDFKTTSVYTYLNQTNDDKYVMQGSIYRWLNPDIITRDDMAIQFIFTDWSGAKARSDANYPQSRTLQKVFGLKSVREIDSFINRKLSQIEQSWNLPEEALPLCTDEELWRSVPVYKYYRDPSKVGGKSTKNFDDLQEANLHRATKGVGVVIEKPGEVTACKYCPAFTLCGQKDLLIERGDLNIGA